MVKPAGTGGTEPVTPWAGVGAVLLIVGAIAAGVVGKQVPAQTLNWRGDIEDAFNWLLCAVVGGAFLVAAVIAFGVGSIVSRMPAGQRPPTSTPAADGPAY